MPGRWSALLGLFLISCLVGLLYAPGMTLVYFGDDFINLFTVPGSRVNFFLQPNRFFPLFYRPLETTFLSFVQSSFPETTLPIHLTTMALHALVCWVLLLGLGRMGFPARAACLAAVFMAVSQANVSAVISIDTISQVASTLFGCVSLFALLGCNEVQACPGTVSEPPGRSARALSVTAFALALLSKETGLFILPLLLGALIIRPASAGNPSHARGVLRGAVPFLVVALLYCAARAHVGLPPPRFGSGMYDLRLGINVPVNAVFLVLVAFLPASSVNLAVAVRAARFTQAAALGLIAVACLALVIWGITRSPHRRSIWWMAAAAVISVAPTCLIDRATEVYLYSAMPFVSALTGVGLHHFLDAAANRWTRRLGAAAVLAAILSGHALASRSKVDQMRRNGEQACGLLRQAVAQASSAPPGACLWVTGPESPAPGYSMFVVPPAELLALGASHIRSLANRPDLVFCMGGTYADCTRQKRRDCLRIYLDPEKSRSNGDAQFPPAPWCRSSDPESRLPI